MCALGSLLLDTPSPPMPFPLPSCQRSQPGAAPPPVSPSSPAALFAIFGHMLPRGRGRTDITQEGGTAWMRGRQPETWGRPASFFRSWAARAPVQWAWLFHGRLRAQGSYLRMGPLTLQLV